MYCIAVLTIVTLCGGYMYVSGECQDYYTDSNVHGTPGIHA